MTQANLARTRKTLLIASPFTALLEAQSSLSESDTSAGENLLSCARTQLRTTINEAREAVWNLRHANISPTAIGPILRDMAQQMSSEFGVPVGYEVSGRAFDFDQDTAHELLMVVREALNNALRHGHPTKVEVSATFESDRFSVRVADDGCGFDPERVSSSSNGHYGLLGMRERIARMSGHLDLTSHPGSGTELILSVPRKSAVGEAATEESSTTHV